MIRKNPRGDLPQVHPSFSVDPTAILCGKVVIEENVFVGPYPIIRTNEVDDESDLEPIVMGAHFNIRGSVVIHAKSGSPVTIGQRASRRDKLIIGAGPAKRSGTGASLAAWYRPLRNCVSTTISTRSG